MSTRRELLQITTTLAASVAAAAQQKQGAKQQPSGSQEPPGEHEHPPAHKEPPETSILRDTTFFKPDELALLTLLVDHIIPRSDTPGAADAKVHLHIDWQAEASPALGERIRRELEWVAGQGFSSKDKAGQVALLTQWSSGGGEGQRIFQNFKELTIDGYYGTREGLQQELGWNANTFVREFKGCTHPEHA